MDTHARSRARCTPAPAPEPTRPPRAGHTRVLTHASPATLLQQGLLLFAASARRHVCQVVSMTTHLGSDRSGAGKMVSAEGVRVEVSGQGGGGGSHEWGRRPHPDLGCFRRRRLRDSSGPPASGAHLGHSVTQQTSVRAARLPDCLRCGAGPHGTHSRVLRLDHCPHLTLKAPPGRSAAPEPQGPAARPLGGWLHGTVRPPVWWASCGSDPAPHPSPNRLRPSPSLSRGEPSFLALALAGKGGPKRLCRL